MSTGSAPTRDRWAAWLLDRRFGGDEAQRDSMLPTLCRYRDEVLRRAGIRHGDTVLDVGCGDGLIGFGAADPVGTSGHVGHRGFDLFLAARRRHRDVGRQAA